VVAVWSYITGPAYSLRPDRGEPRWLPNGVLAKPPVQEDVDGLRYGDLVLAIEGRSVAFWVQALFRPDLPHPRFQVGQMMTFTIVRAGQRLELSVKLTPYPLQLVLARNWANLLAVLAFQLIATFVLLHRRADRAAQLLFLAATCIFGSGMCWMLGLRLTDLVSGSGFWHYWIMVHGIYLLHWAALLHFVLIFPTRHRLIVDRPWLIGLIYGAIYTLYATSAIVLQPRPTITPDWIEQWDDSREAITLLCQALIVGAVISAYNQAKRDAVTRQQIRWVIFAFAVTGGLNIFLYLLPILVLGETVNRDWIGLVRLPLPIALAVAILRYRLFDIDVIINRTLVYGALTASVVGIYVLVVGYLGTLFQTGGNLVISLAATGLVAVLFQPLRGRFQRGVNRLMYGERDEPYAVLARLGQRLEATLAPTAVLPTIVETVTQALKLPYAALVLNGQAGPMAVAAHGTPTATLLHLPLCYQNESVGELRLAPRAPGEGFSSADRRLLADLARQVGVAAHAVQLAADLQRVNTDLQHSRARLVTAQEEERRRLRRDLHDGLGPALAAQTLKVGTARYLVTRDPAAAEAVLAELEADMSTAFVEIRRVVYNLRPPALDEWGLVGAIRATAAQYHPPGSDGGRAEAARRLRVVVDAPEHLVLLPAAVEVAAYRIVHEALTNAVRHAQAQTCHIQITLVEEGPQTLLRLDITDDGCGLPEKRRQGVGLVAMRERAAELGGTCVVAASRMGGTTVRARLPLAPTTERLSPVVE